MANPTQTAPAVSIKPSIAVADDKNKTHTDAAKTDKAGTNDHAKPDAKADAAVKSEPAVAAAV